MFKVKIEFMDEQSRVPIECKIARVPVVGDMIYTEKEVWTVRRAMLAINPNQDEVVAYLRVVE